MPQVAESRGGHVERQLAKGPRLLGRVEEDAKLLGVDAVGLADEREPLALGIGLADCAVEEGIGDGAAEDLQGAREEGALGGGHASPRIEAAMA